MPFLLIAFIGVPIAEIALFIEIGGLIGLWPTIATIVVTALIGTALVRHQGLAVLAEARREMDQSRPPVKAMLTGVCLLLAGALLLTPGFLTDAIGFALLIPPVRMLIGAFLLKRIMASDKVRVRTSGAGFQGSPRGPTRGPGGPVIDGEYADVTQTGTPPSETPQNGAPQMESKGTSRIPSGGDSNPKEPR